MTRRSEEGGDRGSEPAMSLSDMLRKQSENVMTPKGSQSAENQT